MPQNIHQNNVRSLYLKCTFDEYYDFMLYKGECAAEGIDDGCIIADISTDGIAENGKIYSKSTWSGAVSEGVVLKDIGFTGVDNGFISYDKERISNKEFAKLFTGSTYTIESGDTRFFLSPITGNTKNHVYPYTIEDDYIALDGGFFQGFYKLYGFDYQTLPNKILGNEWNLYFKVRPRSDYKEDEKTLNNLYPENKGIFFFMGARAENKFWEYYNISKDVLYELIRDNIFIDGYLKACDDDGDNTYVKACDVSSYYSDYAGDDCEKSGDSITYLYDVDPESGSSYLQAEGKIIDSGITTSDGTEFNAQDLVRINTDNKFITFNRTRTGLTVHNYEESASTKTIEYTKLNSINLFPYMNRTASGYTTDTIDELIQEHGVKEYDVFRRSINNAIAFRITDDGAIGYRTMSCPNNGDTHYAITEEYSKKGIVKDGEWNDIVVKVKLSSPRIEECDNSRHKMKLYFYVNGYLVFISKELDEMNFRELDDIYQKQEGVPFNISLGGGSQGLLEVIWPEYYKTTEYRLPIERNFAGTFIGDIKLFKFIACPIGNATLRSLI